MRRNLGICEQPIERPSLPKIERNQTFLRWQLYSQSKICLWLARQFAFAIAPHESARPQSRTNESLVCRLSKRAGLRRPVWVKLCRLTLPAEWPVSFPIAGRLPFRRPHLRIGLWLVRAHRRQSAAIDPFSKADTRREPSTVVVELRRSSRTPL
jgi:hypothetical protein